MDDDTMAPPLPTTPAMPTTVDGAAPVGATGAPGAPAAASRLSAEDARRLAQTCLADTRDLPDIDLDWTQASLEELDRLLTGPGTGTGGPVRRPTVQALGCYLGEVVVRASGGSWGWVEGEAAPRLRHSLSGVIADPIGAAADRATRRGTDAVEIFAFRLLHRWEDLAANG